MSDPANITGRWRIVWERILVQTSVYEDVLTQEEVMSALQRGGRDIPDDEWEGNTVAQIRLKSVERLPE